MPVGGEGGGERVLARYEIQQPRRGLGGRGGILCVAATFSASYCNLSACVRCLLRSRNQSAFSILHTLMTLSRISFTPPPPFAHLRPFACPPPPRRHSRPHLPTRPPAPLPPPPPPASLSPLPINPPPPLLQARAIEKQIQAAKARDESRGDAASSSSSTATAGPTELRREQGQSALRIGLNATATKFVPGGSSSGGSSGVGGGSELTSAAGTLASAGNGLKRPRISGAFGGGGGGGGEGAGGAGGGVKGKGKGKRSVMEILMDQERAKKAAKEEEEEAAAAAAAAAAEAKAKADAKRGGGSGDGGRKDYWLRAGVVVKVMNKKVGGGKYYKKKARLRKVVERYIGEVKMLDSGDRLRVDQEDLETVRGDATSGVSCLLSRETETGRGGGAGR